MNELLFFSHIFFILGTILLALHLGKSALIALLGLQIVMSNLFVTKQMRCFGFDVTCSDVYTIGILFSLNLLQEYFGKTVAKKAVWITFFLMLTFLIMSQVHLKYLPSPHDTMQEMFKQILTSTPRIIIASIGVSFFSQRLDLLIYDGFRKKFPNRQTTFYFIFASLISQFIDTLLFSFLALYGLVQSMSHIIILSYVIKVSIIFSMAPFYALTKRLIRDSV